MFHPWIKVGGRLGLLINQKVSSTIILFPPFLGRNVVREVRLDPMKGLNVT